LHDDGLHHPQSFCPDPGGLIGLDLPEADVKNDLEVIQIEVVLAYLLDSQHSMDGFKAAGLNKPPRLATRFSFSRK